MLQAGLLLRGGALDCFTNRIPLLITVFEQLGHSSQAVMESLMEVWIRTQILQNIFVRRCGWKHRGVRSGPGLISGAWSEAREACGGPADNPAVPGALNTQDLWTSGNIINYSTGRTLFPLSLVKSLKVIPDRPQIIIRQKYIFTKTDS